jgi:hypothetical protein
LSKKKNTPQKLSVIITLIGGNNKNDNNNKNNNIQVGSVLLSNGTGNWGF